MNTSGNCGMVAAEAKVMEPIGAVPAMRELPPYAACAEILSELKADP